VLGPTLNVQAEIVGVGRAPADVERLPASQLEQIVGPPVWSRRPSDVQGGGGRRPRRCCGDGGLLGLGSGCDCRRGV
jgi:hypothetical protein